MLGPVTADLFLRVVAHLLEIILTDQSVMCVCDMLSEQDESKMKGE